MYKKIILAALPFLSAFSFSHTLVIDPVTNKLLGADNVIITSRTGNNNSYEPVSYQVRFIAGAFRDLFFQDGEYKLYATSTNSYSMIQAVSSIHSGIYDDQPWLTNGCNQFGNEPEKSGCSINLPYDSFYGDYNNFVQKRSFHNVGFESYSVSGTAEDSFSSNGIGIYADNSSIHNSTWAVFTPTPVPAPAALWLLGSALLCMAGLKRKQKN